MRTLTVVRDDNVDRRAEHIKNGVYSGGELSVRRGKQVMCRIDDGELYSHINWLAGGFERAARS